MTISLLIFDHDRMLGDGWQDEIMEDALDRFEGRGSQLRSSG